MFFPHLQNTSHEYISPFNEQCTVLKYPRKNYEFGRQGILCFHKNHMETLRGCILFLRHPWMPIVVVIRSKQSSDGIPQDCLMKVSNNNTEEMKYQNTRHVSKRAANVVMGQEAFLWFFSELRNLTTADNAEKCKYRENGTFQSVGDI